MNHNSIAVLRMNVRARADHVKATTRRGYRAQSEAAGLGGRWLSDFLAPGRYNKKAGTDVIDKLSAILGVPPWALINPEFSADRWPID